MESLHHEHIVCSLVHEEDLVACTGGYCFDVNIIRVKVIQDEHIRVTSGGPMREAPSLVHEDLTGC